MAIYRPTFLSPQNIEIDMANNQMFSCQVNGTVITTYRIKLYRVDTSALLYDTTTITLPSPLYDKDILAHTITGGTIVYKGQIKWTIEVGNGTLSLTSSETPFWNWSDPVYTMTVPVTVTTKSYNFVATYTQAESIAIEKFKFIWYDVDDNIIQDTGWIYSADTQYTFDGFLTGESYSVESVASNGYNYIVGTGKQSFSVLYLEPSLTIIPDAVADGDTSFVNVSWSEAVQIPGYSTGTYNFIDDFLFEGNIGLHIDSGSTVYWNIDIPIDFTCTFILQLLAGFDGIFCQLDGTTQTFQVGYEIDRFYYVVDSIKYYSIPSPIGVNPFLVAIRPTGIYVRYLDIFNIWQDLSALTWQNLSEKTWLQVEYK